MAKKLMFFFLFVLPLTVVSQVQSTEGSLTAIWQNTNEPDSIRYEAFQTYYDFFSLVKPDAALQVTQTHFELAKANKSYKEVLAALNTKGTISTKKGYYTNALRIFKHAAELTNTETNFYPK